MKKKLIIALLAVVLLLAGLGGGVYAANHTPLVQGYKLVGVGTLGTIDGLGDQFRTSFHFNNPDCVNKIAVTRVSILRLDGSVVYMGPYIAYNPGTGVRTIPPAVMNPHEIRGFGLSSYMYTGEGVNPTDYTDPNNWLTTEEALALGRSPYTVEIAYTIKKSTVCPLTGWWHTWYNPAGGSAYPSEGQMVNMKQGK